MQFAVEWGMFVIMWRTSAKVPCVTASLHNLTSALPGATVQTEKNVKAVPMG